MILKRFIKYLIHYLINSTNEFINLKLKNLSINEFFIQIDKMLIHFAFTSLIPFKSYFHSSIFYFITTPLNLITELLPISTLLVFTPYPLRLIY